MEFIRFEVEQLGEIVRAVSELATECPIIIFKAEMGAGKTTLISKFCEFRKVNGSISSPTFSLVNEYETEVGELIYHFDFYRIEDESEAYDMGVFEYFDSGNVCLIEWPEKIENIIPIPHVKVEIEIEGKVRNYKIQKINK